ncbi:DUF7124 domain-containing protein [Haloplanus salilacus]|uniref:DUF7124 domain-containing protein n=1 Tax=Haloplanus salilacus TaxID=2949994 RepID=UPI0030D39E7A
MTLVLRCAALEELEDPPAAIRDARTWTRYVGIVADGSPETLLAALDRRDVEVDFVGEDPIADLASVRQRFPTERHVFVGRSDEDQRTARSLGLEFLPLSEAASKAGWSYHSEE